MSYETTIRSVLHFHLKTTQKRRLHIQQIHFNLLHDDEITDVSSFHLER